VIPSLPRSTWLRAGTAVYAAAFFAFLFLPLVVVAVFAFNDAPYPAPPWRGFTLDWFGGGKGRTGLFADGPLLHSLATSAWVAAWVTLLSVIVIPGVILGISILAFASRLAQFADDLFGLELDFLRPGLTLVVFGQFSYIVAIATLTIAARLKRFDITLEEAAYNLGASRAAVFTTITLPYLKPALIGAAVISFLMSFENFNTTLMLVGSDPPLTVLMYGRMREGASPVLNAVSLFLMLASAALAIVLIRGGRQAE
jgi:spermidine/putrescine transport system permease protein